MSSKRSLPSLQDLTNEKESLRHEALLNTLSYGTDYDVSPKPETPADETIEKRRDEAAELLISSLTSATSNDLSFVDTLWFAAASCPSDNAVAQSNLQNLTKSVLEGLSKDQKHSEQRALLVRKLQVSMDPTFLHSMGIDKDVLLKKMRKVNTDTYYKQQKYNLLQEESEGYAKLLSLLLGKQATTTTTNTPEAVLQVIGTFELDPNRVLDLLLDVVELRITEHKDEKQQQLEQIFEIIREGKFPIDKIAPLIMFKLRKSAGAKGGVPPSLNRTACCLAKEGLLDLELLASPAKKEIHKVYQEFRRLFGERIKAMGRVRLGGGGSSTAEDKLQQQIQNMEAEASKLEQNNILVGLLQVFLSQGDWSMASQIVSVVGDWVELCSLLPSSIGRRLLDTVQSRIQKLYTARVRTPKLGFGNTNTDESEATNTSPLSELLQKFSAALEALATTGCIRSRPLLYSQMCRLVKAELQESGIEPLDQSILLLLQKSLVPALSLFSPNPALSTDLWAVLELLPYPVRYQLYSDWTGAGLEKAGMSSKSLFFVQAEMEAGKSGRYTLKRLSNENVRDMGRAVAKVTHSNPLVVFSTVLNQIESYDNLIDTMVEAVRFVTPLSLDILAYCILCRLTRKGSRLKDDGVNVSQWLQSLESFVGAFYRKCPHVEFRGILCYLVNQLQEGSTVESGLLRNLIKTAGGYSFDDYAPISSSNMEQLTGRAGSQLLKRETCAFGVVDRFNVKSSRRIRSVLQQDKVGITILVLLSQVRHRILFETPSNPSKQKPVKLLGNMYDTCQVVMSMLVQFLTIDESSPSIEKDEPIEVYTRGMPSLLDLSEKFGLDVESAWMLYRPVYRSSPPRKGALDSVVWAMLPPACWKDMAPSLVENFYGYCLYDIFYPEASYVSEIDRLKSTLERLEKEKAIADASRPGMGMFTSADNDELERVRQSVARIKSDSEEQKKHVDTVLKRIKSGASKFFPSETVSLKAVQTLLQRCIYPRCVMGPEDAMHCARFVRLLFYYEAPGFSIMHYLDQLMHAVVGALFSTTESEAACVGIMLLQSWNMISQWRYDKDAFNKDAQGKPGSKMLDGDKEVAVSYDDFKKLYDKWHAVVGTAALGALNSAEYMHKRASFLILTRIVRAYPTKPGMGAKILKALEPLEDDSNPLQDIKASAQAYHASLLKARTDGVWKEEDVAVAKAREAKEKAAVQERKRRTEERFAEMQRDSDKITDQLRMQPGGDERDRGRRPPPPRDSGPPPQQTRSTLQFEPPPRVQRNEQLRGGDGDRRGEPSRRPVAGSLEGRWETRSPMKRTRSPDRDGPILSSKRSREDLTNVGDGPQFSSGRRGDSPPRGRGGPSRNDRGGRDYRRGTARR